MDPSSAESRDRLLQAIDDEIKLSEGTTRALRSRRNAVTPISRLPPEILAAIFSFLSPSTWNESIHLALIRATHVCRRWRETALHHPRLWSHIDFTKLTPAGMAEILARAKMAPLHLEADVFGWRVVQFEAFDRQLEVHISHTNYLCISGPLQSVLRQLIASAPTLEFLSLSHQSTSSFASPQVVVPVNLFNCTTPRLTSLVLMSCDISWKSPLLKGLRNLKILEPSTEARPKLEDWLNALNEMSQLETLHLESATPPAPHAAPLISEPSRAITLPSLTRFHIAASAKDCALALAHLLLPALTQLIVDAESLEPEGEDVRLVTPYIARNIYGLQSKEPLRSILISGERTRAEVLAWTIPDADVGVYDLGTFFIASASAPLVFTATCSYWDYGVETTIFDALLTVLPVDSVSTLTAQNHTRLSKEFWLRHAPRWPLLEQARLVSTAVKAFRDMLVEDAPPDGPRLPLLTKLIPISIVLTAPRTYHLLDMLILRVEQGVPLEVLDLRKCGAADCAIQLLKEIVVDVQDPLVRLMVPSFLDWHGGIGDCNEVEYDNGLGPWYGDTDEDESEDEAEDDDDDESDF